VDKFARIGEDVSNPSPQPDGSTPAAQPTRLSTQLKPGYIVDKRFKVESLIASGGFGTVYKVRHILMNKTFALKTLDPIVASDKTILRLRRESQAVSKLDHPNIVHASDFGLIDGALPFLAMEFVEGPTLAEHLKQCTRLSLESALQIFIPVCNALAYAHEHGVIHRDIKPSNIILASDERDPSHWIPKLCDFGIAKLTFTEEADPLSLTKTGDLFGTPLYMSPEQCAGTTVDNRSDIYALGCVLFEALTGAPPFRGNTALETMMQHATGEALSLREASLGIEFPEALEKLLIKMLAKDSRNRYQSCTDVANDLRLLMKGDVDQMQTAIATPAGAKLIRPMQRADWIWMAIILTIGIAAGAFPTSMYYDKYIVPTAVKSSGETLKSLVSQDITVPARIALDGAYFTPEPGSATFNFPAKVNLGKLRWWTNDAHGQVEAEGSITTIPKGSTIVLEAAEGLVSTPYYWGHFRTTDLSGIYINALRAPFRPEVDDMDRAVANAAQQNNLRILKLENVAMRRRTFNMIGEIPKLKWLSVKKASISDNQSPDSFREVTGEDLASLPNLRNLDTLVANGVHSVTPLLKALKGSKIRRLKIPKGALTADDLIALRQLRSLEVLDILPSDIGSAFACAASLPNLKKLSVVCSVDYFKSRSTVYRFPKLEQLTINQPYSNELKREKWQLIRQRLQLPPHVDWNKNLYVGGQSSDDWFDPHE